MGILESTRKVECLRDTTRLFNHSERVVFASKIEKLIAINLVNTVSLPPALACQEGK
jgi:hypothetical protein